MNFFDIRKLQATLSMIRVAFLSTGVEIDDATIEKILAISSDSAPITQEAFSANVEPSVDVNAHDSRWLISHFDDIIADIRGVFVEYIRGKQINGNVDIHESLSKQQLFDEITQKISGRIYEKLDLHSIVSEVFSAVVAGIKDDAMLSFIPIEDIEITRSGSKSIELNAVVVDDEENFSVIDRQSNPVKGKVALVAYTQGAVVDPSNTHVVATEKTKIIPISQIAAAVLDSTIAKCQSIEAQIKAKFITNTISSSNFGTAFDINIAQKTMLTPDAIISMLSNLGIENVIVSKADVDNSESVKMNFINLKDQLSVNAMAATTANLKSNIKATFDVKSMVELKEEKAYTANPAEITAGTTIYAFVDADSANAIIAMFKLFFGTQISLVASDSAIKNVIGTDIDGDIAAKVSAPLSSKLKQEILSITTRATCRLGGIIRRFLRDYTNETLGEMGGKTLGSLSIFEF